jgi:thiol-disulfide isomerase/thioredoxin
MPGSAGVISATDLDAVVDYVLRLELTALVSRAGLYPGMDRSAPALCFLGEEGTTGCLEQLRGKVVLVAFWGTTCAPCLEELPKLEELAARYEKEKFAVLPLCIDDSSWERAREVAAGRAPHLRVFIDSDGSVRKNYLVPHLPHGILVDPIGRVLARSDGAIRWEGKEVGDLVEACLRARPPVDP